MMVGFSRHGIPDVLKRIFMVRQAFGMTLLTVGSGTVFALLLGVILGSLRNGFRIPS